MTGSSAKVLGALIMKNIDYEVRAGQVVNISDFDSQFFDDMENYFPEFDTIDLMESGISEALVKLGWANIQDINGMKFLITTGWFGKI